MSWRHLRGPKNSITVKIGATDVTVNQLVGHASGVVVATGNNETATGVMHEDGAANEDGQILQVLVPGSIWEAPVTTQTLVRGTRVSIAADGKLKALVTSEWSPGIIVDKDVGPTDTEASILIDPRN